MIISVKNIIILFVFFGIEKGNGKTFKPSDLFSVLNIKLLELELSNLFQPKCYEIAKFHSDVEESEKIYFKRLLNNNLRKNSVTDRNFEKTSKLIGKEIAIDLKNKRIHAVIYEQNLAPKFYNEDKAQTPQVLLDWIKELKGM